MRAGISGAQRSDNPAGPASGWLCSTSAEANNRYGEGLSPAAAWFPVDHPAVDRVADLIVVTQSVPFSVGVFLVRVVALVYVIHC